MSRQAAAAVVNCPWVVEDGSSLRQAIEEILRLGIQSVVMPFETDASESTKNVIQAVIADLRQQEPKPTLHPLEVKTPDSAYRWQIGIREAFAKTEADVVFLFPGDLESTPSEENRTGWRTMLDGCRSNSLAVGDYYCSDAFKTEFDSTFLLKTIERLHPSLAPRLQDLGLSKARSEVFCLGRKFFQAFEQSSRHDWGADPTIQLLLFGLAEESFSVDRVPFGFFSDYPGNRNPLERYRQVLRIVNQLTLDLLRKESFTGSRKWTRQWDRTLEIARGSAELTRDLVERFSTFLEEDNKKLSLTPNWSEFPGFSFLFDPPSSDLTPHDSAPSLLKIGAPPKPGSLFGILFEFIGGWRGAHLCESSLVCPLPSGSAHVTVVDGINADNVLELNQDHQSIYRDFLEGLPESLEADMAPEAIHWPFWEAGEPLECIRFKFKKLTLWESSLVARLEPADEPSERVFEKIVEARESLDRRLCGLGKRPAQEYEPHVSLAYGFNRALARRLAPKLERWTQELQSLTAGVSVEFRSVSAYAFTDMATFLKLS